MKDVKWMILKPAGRKYLSYKAEIGFEESYQVAFNVIKNK